jgi:hypothetical protein
MGPPARALDRRQTGVGVATGQVNAAPGSASCRPRYDSGCNVLRGQRFGSVLNAVDCAVIPSKCIVASVVARSIKPWSGPTDRDCVAADTLARSGISTLGGRVPEFEQSFEFSMRNHRLPAELWHVTCAGRRTEGARYTIGKLLPLFPQKWKIFSYSFYETVCYQR